MSAGVGGYALMPWTMTSLAFRTLEQVPEGLEPKFR
jgi:hypothetical protein